MVAYTVRAGRDFHQTRAFGFLKALEGDFLEAEFSIVDKQGEHMAAGLQFSLYVAVQRLPLTFAAGIGNFQKIGKIRQTVETVFCQVEPAAG